MQYEYRQGETIVVGLDAVRGDASIVTDVASTLRRVQPGGLVDGSTAAATFVVTPRAATGDQPGGWILTLSSIISSNLPLGSYRADARLTIGAAVQFTDPINISIVAPITSVTG